MRRLYYRSTSKTANKIMTPFMNNAHSERRAPLLRASLSTVLLGVLIYANANRRLRNASYRITCVRRLPFRTFKRRNPRY